MYQLRAMNQPPELDGLRAIVSNADLITWAMDSSEIGRQIPDRGRYIKSILDAFKLKRNAPENGRLKNQLTAASDHGAAIEILRKIQKQTVDRDSATG